MCEDHTVLRHDYPGQACSLAHSLEVIGERWSLLIIRDVMNGNRRFSGIQASLGVAKNVLSARLQRLIDEDILERRAYQANPPRYEYFLTEKGLDLGPALKPQLHAVLRELSRRHGPKPKRQHVFASCHDAILAPRRLARTRILAFTACSAESDWSIGA